MTTALVAPTCYRTVTALGHSAYCRIVEPFDYPFALVSTGKEIHVVPTHWLVRIHPEEFDKEFARVCPPPTPAGS